MVALAVLVSVKLNPFRNKPEPQIDTTITDKWPSFSIKLGNYKFKNENDNWHIVFTDEFEEKSQSSAQTCDEEQEIIFDNFDEMMSSISHGGFSAAQLNTIKNTFKKDDIGTLLFDIANPAIPVFPDNYHIKNIVWEGCNYTINIESDNNSI